MVGSPALWAMKAWPNSWATTARTQPRITKTKVKAPAACGAMTRPTPLAIQAASRIKALGLIGGRLASVAGRWVKSAPVGWA